VIQKTKLQESSSIKKRDMVLYYDEQGSIKIDEIQKISAIGSFKTYYLNNKTNNNKPINNKPILTNQIIGKVIIKVNNNILNTISLKIWDISIHSLNIKAFFSN